MQLKKELAEHKEAITKIEDSQWSFAEISLTVLLIEAVWGTFLFMLFYFAQDRNDDKDGNDDKDANDDHDGNHPDDPDDKDPDGNDGN